MQFINIKIEYNDDRLIAWAYLGRSPGPVETPTSAFARILKVILAKIFFGVILSNPSVVPVIFDRLFIQNRTFEEFHRNRLFCIVSCDYDIKQYSTLIL